MGKSKTSTGPKKTAPKKTRAKVTKTELSCETPECGFTAGAGNDGPFLEFRHAGRTIRADWTAIQSVFGPHSPPPPEVFPAG